MKDLMGLNRYQQGFRERLLRNFKNLQAINEDFVYNKFKFKIKIFILFVSRYDLQAQYC